MQGTGDRQLAIAAIVSGYIAAAIAGVATRSADAFNASLAAVSAGVSVWAASIALRADRSGQETQAAAEQTLDRAHVLVTQVEELHERGRRARGYELARHVLVALAHAQVLEQVGNPPIPAERASRLYLDLLAALAPALDDEFPKVRQLVRELGDYAERATETGVQDTAGISAAAEAAVSEVSEFVRPDILPTDARAAQHSGDPT